MILSVLPSLALQLSHWDEDPGEAQEGSVRTFISVLAMKHCEGLTGNALHCKSEIFQRLPADFFGEGSLGCEGTSAKFCFDSKSWEFAKENVTSLVIFYNCKTITPHSNLVVINSCLFVENLSEKIIPET